VWRRRVGGRCRGCRVRRKPLRRRERPEQQRPRAHGLNGLRIQLDLAPVLRAGRPHGDALAVPLDHDRRGRCARARARGHRGRRKRFAPIEERRAVFVVVAVDATGLRAGGKLLLDPQHRALLEDAVVASEIGAEAELALHVVEFRRALVDECGAHIRARARRRGFRPDGLHPHEQRERHQECSGADGHGDSASLCHDRIHYPPAGPGKSMASSMKMLSNLLMKGLVTILPIGLTIYFLIWVVKSAESVTHRILSWVAPQAPYWPGMGIAAGLLVLLLVGSAVNAYVVRHALGIWEEYLERIPVVKTVYGAIRDMTRLLPAGGAGRDLRSVVIFEVGGARLLGFVTREDLPELEKAAGVGDLVAVFVPLSYMIGGLTLYVPRAVLTHVDMPVETAMRLALTGGMTAHEGAQSGNGEPPTSRSS
jgi:uncharacterized membrane protein